MRKPIDNGSGAGRKEECGHREDLRQCGDVSGRAGATLAAARSFRTSTLRSFGHSMAPGVPAIGKTGNRDTT
jgi:hypothetical protein